MKKLLPLLILAHLSAHAEPLIRFGRLTVKPDAHSTYTKAIKEDIALSIRDEPHAHTMAAMHNPAQADDYYVIEIYSDADWEQQHRQTSQYKNFAAATADSYADKQLIEVQPRYINEDNTPLTLGGP